MKKILTIIFLGLMFSGNAYAFILDKCYLERSSYSNPTRTTFNSEKYLEFYFNVDTANNSVTKIITHKDEEDNSPKYDDSGLIAKVTYADHKYIKAIGLVHNEFLSSGPQYTISLKNNTVKQIYVITDEYQSNRQGMEYGEDYLLYQCERSSESSGGSNVASSGSGFFINNKGYFITNNHVVKGCKQSKITFKEESVDADVIATDQTLDLALLKAKVKPRNYLNLSDDPPEKLQKIYVAGYPFGKGLSDDLKLTQGIISSVKGYGNNSNQIQIDAAINSGNSGGPIVDEDGDLVGVAVSGLNKSQAEGIAFGIKSAAVKNFLDVNKIKYSTSSLMNFGMSNKKLNNLLEDSAVYTFCN